MSANGDLERKTNQTNQPSNRFLEKAIGGKWRFFSHIFPVGKGSFVQTKTQEKKK